MFLCWYSQCCFEIFTSVAFAEPCAKPRARGASPGLHGDAWTSSQVWQCTGKVITTGLLSCSCMRRQSPRIQLLKEPDIKLEMRQSCKGWLKFIKKCLFPSWPLPPRCFSAALCWFALPTINAPSKSRVWFPLGWGVELQRDTEKGSGMSPFGQKSVWCSWGWHCVGPVPQG